MLATREGTAWHALNGLMILIYAGVLQSCKNHGKIVRSKIANLEPEANHTIHWIRLQYVEFCLHKTSSRLLHQWKRADARLASSLMYGYMIHTYFRTPYSLLRKSSIFKPRMLRQGRFRDENRCISERSIVSVFLSQVMITLLIEGFSTCQGTPYIIVHRSKHILLLCYSIRSVCID